MSSGEVRRVSRQDIQLVQNLIERCLQLYMNQKEVVETLLFQAKIEPGFTELVWQKLEEENQEFFKAYRVRLMLKHQIIMFNQLLGEQAALMVHQNSVRYASEHTASARSDNFCRPLSPSAVVNGGRSSMYQSMQPVPDTSRHAGKIEISPHLLPSQNMPMELLPGMNGMTIKSESEFSNHSDFSFSSGGDILETHPIIGDASLASLNSTETHPLGEPLPDPDSTQFGYLSQIPRNFSLSDLTADFSQSAEILANYSGSLFLDDSFPDSNGRNQKAGENRELDPISECVSYEDFGSD
ncbi:hypothetical protein QJS10_CPA03g01709 [Acorus calamus]|uniref:Uncharacterized protein n=1 Tax=Acorus calamus TaxID=4465 RepID=A0AAV9F8B5_ACOCL|nr:hypothetical protein QJS10_CPA03g01709 [Acorus calamus]